tara:strand:+ start:415 stop:882 length:468 start_codon:yes stop_codon:yes gene_type:complete
MKNKISIAFLAFYLIQYFIGVNWGYLAELQTTDLYKNWSGLALFLLIITQWTLSLFRSIYSVSGSKKETLLNIHEWAGVFSPLLFFIHTVNPGYGLLLFLTSIFAINLLLASLPMSKIKVKKPNLYFTWLTIHIGLAAIVVVLAIFHIWIVFYYE